MKRGEIWWIDLEPTRGSEIAKTRPCVVISGRLFDGLRVRLVVPITTWQPRHEDYLHYLTIDSSPGNGLRNLSSADAMQVRSVSLDRFKTRLGVLEQAKIDELVGLMNLVMRP